MTDQEPIVLPTGRVGGAYPKQALDMVCPAMSRGEQETGHPPTCNVCGGRGLLPTEAGEALLAFFDRWRRVRPTRTSLCDRI